MLDRHAVRLQEVQDQLRKDLEAQLEYDILSRMWFDKVDRKEAMRISLENPGPDRRLLAEEMREAIEDENERLQAELLNLEQWAAS